MSAARLLSPGRYGFNNVQIGDFIETGAVTISAELIDRFADLSGDRFEIHMKSDAARKHGFDDRVAHGLLVLSVVDGLKNRSTAQFRARASLGWDWKFRVPVLINDEISATISVVETRPTKSPNQGILRLKFLVRNQRGSIVQEGDNLLLAYN